MKKVFAPILALFIAVTFFGSAGRVAADHPGGGGSKLSTTLTGAEEVKLVGGQLVTNQGDLDGSGTADLRLNSGQEEICFELNAVGIEPAGAAHIHIGPAGQNGRVVVGLLPPTTGSSSGCVHADRELIKAIRSNPENYYVNVHNQPFPGGALRGQLGD